MKLLKRIIPWLFLVLSLGCALFTAVRTETLQRNLLGGVLAVLDQENGTGENHLIVEREDGSPLYKNGAAERIRKEYGIILSNDRLTELDPVKKLLSQSWKFCLAGIYFLTMLWIWKVSMGCIVRGYTGCKSQKITKTAAEIFLGILLYLSSLGIWYCLICFIDIPQQYIPLAGIWDLGYIAGEIRGFHEKVQSLGEQIPVLADAWRAGKTALVGYGASILLFLPGWAALFSLRFKR